MSYTVGSLADLISQKPEKKKSKKTKKETENNEAAEEKVNLQKLFESAPPAAIHVPIPSAAEPSNQSGQPESKNKRKKKTTSEEYSIEVLKTKKPKKENENEEGDVLDSLLDLPAAGSDDEEPEAEVSDKSASQATLKQRENKNLKKLENKKKKKQGAEENKDSKGVIFVKNLPIKVERKTVKYLFRKYGKIQSVWIRCAAIPEPSMPKKIAIIKKEFHPERASISAYVRFEDPADAEKALEMNGTVYEEHHLAVSLAHKMETKRDMGKAIFVGNLPFNIEDEALWTFFQDCGEIADVRIIRDRATGQGKGFGYVNFESSDAVELALKLNGSEVSGREIRVQRCSKKVKKPNPKETQKNQRKVPEKAHRRILEKKGKRSGPRKDQTWTAALRKKSKKPTKPSFAGEAATEGGKIVKQLRPGKAAKKNKAEIQKQIIAEKLSAV